MSIELGNRVVVTYLLNPYVGRAGQIISLSHAPRIAIRLDATEDDSSVIVGIHASHLMREEDLKT